MFDYHKPAWLYEPLPYLYLGSGMASIVSLDHLLSAFSGLLLMSAGIVVWKLRHDHRHAEAEKRRRQSLRRKPRAPMQI